MDLPSRIASWLGENEGTISAVVGIIVYTQAVGGSSPSAPTGRLTFHVLAAMAELERDLIRERTMAGLELARKKGKKLGRPLHQADRRSAWHLPERRSSRSERGEMLRASLLSPKCLPFELILRIVCQKSIRNYPLQVSLTQSCDSLSA